MERYKPSTVNTRIYGINQYVAALQSGGDMSDTGPYTPAASIDFLEPYKLPSVRHQQKPFLNNVISKRDYERLKRGLKRDNNMFWYFVVRFLGATGARVSELIQIKAEHMQIGCMDLYSKGGKVRRIYFPEPTGQPHYSQGHKQPAEGAGKKIPDMPGYRLPPLIPAPFCQKLSD